MSTPSLADGVLRPAPLSARTTSVQAGEGVTVAEPDIEPTSAWRWRKSRCRSRGRLGALRMTGFGTSTMTGSIIGRSDATGIYVSIGT